MVQKRARLLLSTILASLVGLVVAGRGDVHADDRIVHEVRFGLLAHDMPALWSGFRLEPGIDVNGEILFKPSVAFLGGQLRPAIGGSVNVSDGGKVSRGTSKAYADIRWTYDFNSRWFAGLGIGAAIHNGNLDPTDPARKALGSRVLFHFPFEIGFRIDPHSSISLYFDHMSNAYTRPSNEGLDTLGVRYGYRF